MTFSEEYLILTKKGGQKFKEIKPATDRWMLDTGSWSLVTCHLLLTAGYWSPVGTESDPTLPLNPKSQIPNPQSKRFDYLANLSYFYTAFHKNIPAGISGCRKKRLNNGTFF